MDGNITLEVMNYRGTVCCLQTWYFNVMYIGESKIIHNIGMCFAVGNTAGWE
jgi:hypothetical protein